MEDKIFISPRLDGPRFVDHTLPVHILEDFSALEELLIEKYELEDKIIEIQKAIENLPADARTIVNLFLFENIPQEEIANMLGISNTTVRSKYHRAKQKIAQILQQTMYYE